MTLTNLIDEIPKSVSLTEVPQGEVFYFNDYPMIGMQLTKHERKVFDDIYYDVVDLQTGNIARIRADTKVQQLKTKMVSMD